MIYNLGQLTFRYSHKDARGGSTNNNYPRTSIRHMTQTKWTLYSVGTSLLFQNIDNNFCVQVCDSACTN